MADILPTSTVYEPSPLPAIRPSQLAEALNPASHYDPTSVALSLLKLIPDAPPFLLVTRLAWCIKPEAQDWDLPEFPYLYADIEGEGELTAEDAAFITKRPVPDDVAFDALERFAARVIDSLGPAVSVILDCIPAAPRR